MKFQAFFMLMANGNVESIPSHNFFSSLSFFSGRILFDSNFRSKYDKFGADPQTCRA